MRIDFNQRNNLFSNNVILNLIKMNNFQGIQDADKLIPMMERTAAANAETVITIVKFEE